MVHVFQCLGQTIALDVDSGALHRLDRLAADVIERFEGETLQQIQADLAERYSPQAVEEAYGEITQLRDMDQLFTRQDHYQALPSEEPSIIKALCLHVAHDCNMRCNYCFAGSGPYGQQRRLMDLHTGKRALEFLISHSGERRNLEVDFFGGEPLLNFDVVCGIVAYGRELERRYGKSISFTITTNALALDADKAKFINREMDNLVISLDGRKGVHERMRHPLRREDSYEALLQKAQDTVAARGDKPYFVRGTYTRYNPDFTQDVLALYHAGFNQISIEPVVGPLEADYSLGEDMLEALFAEYERLAMVYQQAKNEGKPFTFFHFFLDLEHAPCLSKKMMGCGAGNEYIAVTPEGDIYPCHQFVGNDAYRMGNVRRDRLDACMQRAFATANVLTKPDCARCWAKYYCSGGCSANALQQNGDINKPYQIGCALQKKRLECALALAVMDREGYDAV